LQESDWFYDDFVYPRFGQDMLTHSLMSATWTLVWFSSS